MKTEIIIYNSFSSVSKLKLFEEDDWDKKDDDYEASIDIQKGFGEIMKKHLNKNNRTKTTFTRQENIIQWDRSEFKMSNDEVMRIRTESAMLDHYWTDEKGKPNANFHSLHHEEHWEWEAMYDLQEHPNKGKLILGYACELITIMETKKNKKTSELSTSKFDLYVTGELGIPYEFIIPLWEKLDGRTALEIRHFPSNTKGAFEIRKAILVEQKDLPKIKLPRKFLEMQKSS